MTEQTLAQQAGYTTPFKADDKVRGPAAIRDANGRVAGWHSNPSRAAELADELNRDGYISSVDA